MLEEKSRDCFFLLLNVGSILLMELTAMELKRLAFEGERKIKRESEKLRLLLGNNNRIIKK